eukprot:4290675-Amphidinium_carterae.1
MCGLCICRSWLCGRTHVRSWRMRTELLAAEGIPLSSPRLEVAWGRQANGSDPIKNKFTEIGTGGDGQYNFLQKISLFLPLRF